jgi:hypothetical protein
MAYSSGENSLERLWELQLEIGALLGIQVVINHEPLPPTRWQRVKRWLDD